MVNWKDKNGNHEMMIMNGKKTTFQSDAVSINSGDWLDGSTRGALKSAQKQKRKLYTILVVVGIIPILFLCGLTLYQLIKYARIRNDAADARDNAINFIKIAQTISALQVEREVTPLYVRSRFELYTEFSDSVDLWRDRVDSSIELIDYSLIEGLPQEIDTREKLKDSLATYRSEVDDLQHSPDDITDFFTLLISNLFRSSQLSVHLPSEGNLWRTIGAGVLLLRATAPASAASALMRSLSIECDRSTAEINELLGDIGGIEALINQAGNLVPSVRKYYNENFKNTQLEKDIDETVNLVISNQFRATCRRFPRKERNAWEFPWHVHFVSYTHIIEEMEKDLINQLTAELDAIVYEEENLMMMYIVIFLLVALICVVLNIIQVRGQARIVKQVVTLATRSKAVTLQFSSERKKADLLLYRMMPASVAEQMKHGRKVPPQNFSNVTICYIDIVGFVAMISRMEPIVVTNMMGSLYKMFDDLLDEHDIYKMEQSNDVYSVVSGVPDHIDTHAAEIGNFAIEILKNVETFKINASNEKLQVRIGIHTGPCAAAIIGQKSLRYSIFGESVKMASRMSRNSEAQKIQISRETRDALLIYGDVYIIKDRGHLDIYGIGSVKTYYLEGHRSGRRIPGLVSKSTRNF